MKQLNTFDQTDAMTFGPALDEITTDAPGSRTGLGCAATAIVRPAALQS